MSANTQQVHNTGRHELVYTSQGHILPGNTTGNAPEGDPVTQRLINSGRLILCTPAAVPKPQARTRRGSKTTGVEAPKEVTRIESTASDDTSGEPQESTDTTTKEKD